MNRNSRSPHGIQSLVSLSSAARSGGGSEPISLQWPRRLRVAKRQRIAPKSCAANGKLAVAAMRRTFRSVRSSSTTSRARVKRRSFNFSEPVVALGSGPPRFHAMSARLKSSTASPPARSAWRSQRSTFGVVPVERKLQLRAQEIELAETALVARGLVEVLQPLDEVRGVRALPVVRGEERQ